MQTQAKTKIALAAGLPIAAGAGIGIGSYAGLTGVSAGIKNVASGGSKEIQKLGIGLVVVVILIAVLVYAYTKVR
jgi:hypothetical protein